MSNVDYEPMDIAVIGMAGRFPGAPDIARFWRNLREGVESITSLDERDLIADGVAPELIQRPGFVRAGSVLADIDLFDAGFFGFAPREAALLDPQQRIFLECAWEALENAAYDPQRAGVVGVYAGSNLSTYLVTNLLSGARLTPNAAAFELLIHNDKDYLATRTAYKLDLAGPCVSVQTACSTSLVAVHLAAMALLNGECDLALAGGVSVRVPQHSGYQHEEGLIFSRDGHCRPFDADADGTVFGNGAGVVVLKRLSDALEDGDHVEAVIKASATNNDGSRKVGYTAPSVDGQTRVIAAALAAGELDAGSITAIEAHGTGTAIGDPIEVTALTRAFREYTDRTGYCAIGSVKSNVGHLDTAAGIAGLIKAILQLKHGELVPSLHFRRPNPQIDFDRTPFFVNAGNISWKSNGSPRRIGVSSFGIGGTNAHVILQEPPAPRIAPPPPPRREQVVVLSGTVAQALDEAGERLASHVKARPELELADVAYTLQVGRRHHRHRRAVVCTEPGDLPALLGGETGGGVLTWDSLGERPDVVLLLPGQGAQYPGMGHGLYTAERVYRETVDECAELLRPLLGSDLREPLLTLSDVDGPAAERLAHTAFAQPAMFVTEYAMARLLDSWGIQPAAMVGHSVGELVAACLAGVFELPDALRVVTTRARLMAEQPTGAMLSVAAGEERIRGILPAELSVAAVNAAELTVVSGPTPAVRAFERELAGHGISGRKLRTSHAFHSAMMEPVVAAFTRELSGVAMHPPKLRFTSNVTGAWITPEQATDPGYWASQVRSAVRFADCVRTATADRTCALLEAGPGHALGTIARQSLPTGSRTAVVAAMRTATDSRTDTRVLQTALAQLWVTGVEVDWAAVHGPARPRLELPTYPFQRRRYWVDARSGAGALEQVDTAQAPGEQAEGDLAGGGSRPPLLTAFLAPRTEIERTIAGVWEEFFGIVPIGVHDSFFELGGHSLLAARIVNRLREAGVDVPLNALLSAPTVAGVAAIAESTSDTSGAMPVAVPDPAARFEPFPLLEMQQAQWLGRLGSFEMGEVAAHVYLEYESDTLDAARLERAWARVLERHDMLRVVVSTDGRQRVLPDVPPYRFEVVEGEDAAARLRDRMATAVRPVDEWPLWEVSLSTVDGGGIRVHVSFDLIVADVASFFFQVSRDWQRFYEDPGWDPAPLELSFRDYVLAEAALRETPLWARSLEYWRERVKTLPAAPQLPEGPGLSGPAVFTRRHARVEPERWERIKALAAGFGVTPSVAILAAYAWAVGRWSKEQHFTLNLTAVNRLPFHPQVEELVGEFASFNLLEVDLRGVQTLADLARQIQQRSWEDLEHRHVSGVRVLRELARVRGSATAALMPVVFTSALMQDTGDGGGPFAWLGAQRHVISQTPQVSLDHFVMAEAGALDLSWHSVDELFAAGVLDDMFEMYRRVVDGLADEAGWDVLSADLPGWQEKLLAQVNDTAGPLPDGLLADAVLARGITDPDRPAVFSHDRWMSYGELSRRAVDLAKTVAGRDVVAIGAGKGWRQIVAVLAASAAGAVYVPVDAGLPEERRRWLLEHAGVSCVLIDRDDADLWTGFDVEVLPVPEGDGWQAADVAGWTCPAKPADTAYVIYTSGSTGQPKGVAVSHRAALNTLVDVCRRYQIDVEDRVLGLSSLSFDLSVFDVFGVLGAGGGLVLPQQGTGRDPEHWWQLVSEHRVTVWNSVPALAAMLSEYAAGREGTLPLRVVLLSGDWVPVDLPGRLRRLAPQAEVVSLGGATEAAVWSIAYPTGDPLPGWSSVPYGRPLTNQRFSVVNARGERCPVWVTGELLIGGEGVAQGYWQDPERTAASFVHSGQDGGRWYRTGDLGRYRPEGLIEFLGREDFQVKIGGYRIELGEIEHAVSGHPDVQRAIVVATGDRGHQRLVAYLTTHREDLEPDALVDRVREHLAQRLPGYLMPAQFVVLDALPLSPNGKVDRSALPAHGALATGQPGGTALDGAVQAIADRLAVLVAEVLGVEQVGPYENFFELGGDSIRGIQVVTAANAMGLALTPQQMFEHQTVAGLAQALAHAVTVEHDSSAPLTPYQEMLLSADPADAGEWLMLDLTGDFDTAVAEQAWGEVRRRHTALLLALDDANQYGAGAVADVPYLPEIDLSAIPADERPGLADRMVAEMAGELDPRSAATAKLATFQFGPGQRRLVWLAHRCIVDDRGWQLLARDFALAYRQLAAGEPVRWPGPSGRFHVWAATSAAAELPPIAGDDSGAERNRSVALEVPADELAAARDAAFGAYHLSLAETVVAALVLALGDGPLAGRRVVVARAARGEDDRDTVGNFGTFLPLTLAPQAEAAVASVLEAVKDGWSAGSQPTELSDQDILVPETLDEDWQLPTGVPLRWPEGFAGPLHRGRVPAGPQLAVGAAVVDGALRLRWDHAEQAGPAVVAAAGRLRQALADIAAHCRSADEGSYRPSDFPYADLDEASLQSFLRHMDSK